MSSTLLYQAFGIRDYRVVRTTREDKILVGHRRGVAVRLVGRFRRDRGRKPLGAAAWGLFDPGRDIIRARNSLQATLRGSNLGKIGPINLR